jgi:hypothetical protein
MVRVLHAPSPTAVSCWCWHFEFAVCVFMYIPSLFSQFTVLFGSCFKSGVPDFVGRDSLSLFTATGLRPLISRLWAMFLVIYPFGDVFFGMIMKKMVLCSKKKKKKKKKKKCEAWGLNEKHCITSTKAL